MISIIKILFCTVLPYFVYLETGIATGIFCFIVLVFISMSALLFNGDDNFNMILRKIERIESSNNEHKKYLENRIDDLES